MVISGRWWSVFAAFAVSAVASPASAKCLAPPAQVLWSIPADGAQDVPTNVNPWIAVPVYYKPDVHLDGKPLAAEPNLPYQWQLAKELPPHTHHELTVHFVHPPDLPVDVTIAFDTGAGPDMTVPQAPQVTALATDASLTAACLKEIRAQYCFDTGEPSVRTLVSPTTPVAWQVTRKDGSYAVLTSAGHCGVATYMGYLTPWQKLEPVNTCWQVRAIDATGRLSPATEACEGAVPGPEDPTATVATSIPMATSGCRAGPSPGAGWSLLAGALWVLRRRLRGVRA